MKVYKSVTIDIATGETLAEDSYEYDGPVAECKGDNTHSTFQHQQSTAFDNLGGASNAQMNLYNTFNNMMGQRFGSQSQAFGIMQKNLQNVLGRGTGLNRLNGAWWQTGPGMGGGAADDGGGGDGGGARGGGGGGGMGGSPFDNLQFTSGFNPSDYGYQSAITSGLGRTERVMRTQAAEENAQAFQNSLAAQRDRLLQMGGAVQPGSGAEAQLIAQNENAAAAAAAQGQRDVVLNIQDQRLQNSRLKAQLDAGLKQGLGPARMKSAEEQNQWNMAIAQQQAQEQARRQAMAQRAAAMRMQAGAARQAQSLSQQRFNAQMKLMGIQMQNDNYWKAMQAMGGLANAQNPLDYGQLGLGATGQNSQQWGGAYNTASQGFYNTRHQGMNWGKVLGAIGGAAMNFATGGMSGLFGGMLGGGGSQQSTQANLGLDYFG